MFRWLPYTRTKRENLFTPVCANTGQYVALINGDSYCLPLFSTRAACESWLLGMKMEQHYVSPPLPPKRLHGVLLRAKKDGFNLVCLDPPASKSIGFPAGQIDTFIDRAAELAAQKNGSFN